MEVKTGAKSVVIHPILMKALKAAKVDKLKPKEHLFLKWSSKISIAFLPEGTKPTKEVIEKYFTIPKGKDWKHVKSQIRIEKMYEGNSNKSKPIAKIFSRIKEELKIKGEKTFYSWKHTGAIAALQSGMNVVAISKQMGHTTLTNTQRYVDKLPRTDAVKIYNIYPRKS